MTIEDIVWDVRVEFEIPDQNHSIRISTVGLLGIVGAEQHPRMLVETKREKGERKEIHEEKILYNCLGSK